MRGFLKTLRNLIRLITSCITLCALRASQIYSTHDMANREKILKTIADFSTERLVEFLDVNGLANYANVIRIKNIDGATFLNLSEFQINRWKPLISMNEVRQFWIFLSEVKTIPEKFHHGDERGPENTYDNKEVTSKSPIAKSVSVDKSNTFGSTSPGHEARLNITREDLENLCKNEEVLNTLKSFLKSRDIANGVHVEDESVYGNDVVTAESLPVPKLEPPPIPRGAKPTPFVKSPTTIAPPPETETDDSELIYEDPPEIPVEVVRKMDTPRAGSLLPGRPSKMPAKIKAALPAMPEAEDYMEPSNNQPRQLTKMKLQPPGPMLEKLPMKPAQKISIRDTPLPPPPDVNSKSQRKQTENKLEDIFSRKLNAKIREPESRQPVNEMKSLPRPPKLFPNLTDAPDFGEKPINNRMPACYRYTDRKGSEMLLTEDLGDGSYLLRPSRKFYCTLSVRYQRKIYHIGIEELEDGTLQCESSSNNFHFDSLNQIAMYFKENPMTLTDGNNLHTVCLRDVLPANRT